MDTPLLDESALVDGYQVIDMFAESDGQDFATSFAKECAKLIGLKSLGS